MLCAYALGMVCVCGFVCGLEIVVVGLCVRVLSVLIRIGNCFSVGGVSCVRWKSLLCVCVCVCVLCVLLASVG